MKSKAIHAYMVVQQNGQFGNTEEKKALKAEIKDLKGALLEKSLELEKEKARSEKLSCKVDSLHGQLRRWERWDSKRKWEEDEKREGGSD